MREIKFRAWDGKNFIYSEKVTGSYWGDIVLDGPGPDYVIQQYTGLKDKNGKEIYEGDIVKFDEQTAIIKFGEYECWQHRNFGNGFYIELESGIYGFTKDFAGACEIIGNVYENPELK